MRIHTILSAVALIAGAALADGAGEASAPVKKDHPLPKLELLDEDGDPYGLTEVVDADVVTVIMFFDPEKGPTFLSEAKSDVPGLTTAFTRVYNQFKHKEVTWVFVALGETAAVDTACTTWELARDDEREAALARFLAAREAEFAAFRKAIEDSGIEEFTVYVTAKRPAPGATRPACAIVRGKKNVAHVAAAGDRRAIDALVGELRLAVKAPEGSGKESLPASSPR